ncbi:DNA methyltransferase [Microbacterium halotolerans]|uniref:DNA methyltransferase n=1 Tax=Microbacterium halotolerans TaxID=246613 RepID=UPI000E6ADEAA|nr:DNA methyltransferase [Microbacterium halotolerans]
MTKPYYQDDLVTLYHGSCLEVREWLETDVLVTDPPYGTQNGVGPKKHRGGYGRRDKYDTGDGMAATIAGDETTETRDAALELWGGRAALVFGSPRLPDPPIAVADRLVWDKRRPGMNGGPWRYRHESIYVTEGFVRASNAAVSIMSAFPEQGDHIHGKPVKLMEALVAAAPPGIIADPFAGSGATLLAARNLGRRAVGVEFEERYCEVIVRRLGQQAFNFDDLLRPASDEVRASGWANDPDADEFAAWAPANVTARGGDVA